MSVAPFNLDSTTLREKRTAWEWARQAPCRSLYVSVVATRHNPVIRDLYPRLLTSDRPKRPALPACMRKLLAILNPMPVLGIPRAAAGSLLILHHLVAAGAHQHVEYLSGHRYQK